MKIILASKSPRRRELLGELYSEFEVVTLPVDEGLDADIHPRDGVQILAVRKGEAVVDTAGDGLIISSDTLVELDGVPFGKPVDRADAIRMLKALSGRDHSVHTGVAVHYRGRVFSGVDSTRVSFKELSDEQIADYVDSGEPMDKAGAYAIQGEGGRLVSGIDGDFDTVVGLSLKLVKKLIKAAIESE